MEKVVKTSQKFSLTYSIIKNTRADIWTKSFRDLMVICQRNLYKTTLSSVYLIIHIIYTYIEFIRVATLLNFYGE